MNAYHCLKRVTVHWQLFDGHIGLKLLWLNQLLKLMAKQSLQHLGLFGY